MNTTGPLLLVVLAPMLLGVAGLWVLFYGPWQRQCVDVARRELFAARDEIFLLFAMSELGVDHPSHRQLRHAFNLMIRYAHRITWLRVVLYAALSPGGGRGETAMALKELGNHEIAERVRRRLAKGLHATFRSMVRRSLPLLALTILMSTGRHLGVRLTKLGQTVTFAAAAESIIVVAEREEETAASARPRRANAAA